jgi:hypothetical protein
VPGRIDLVPWKASLREIEPAGPGRLRIVGYIFGVVCILIGIWDFSRAWGFIVAGVAMLAWAIVGTIRARMNRRRWHKYLMDRA